jgi:hypothetical protein
MPAGAPHDTSVRPVHRAISRRPEPALKEPSMRMLITLGML